jgi:serine/threonine-protein kinase
MAPLTLAQLTERLASSQLLDQDHLEELPALEAKCADAAALGQELVTRGWLTFYQVEQIKKDCGGDLVLGQYILMEPLGEGGMGQVFKARQRNLHRLVALKIIRRERLDNDSAIQRFQREIRAAGQLCHPNIVHAYDADQINGHSFIAMELVDGVDLSQLVKDEGPLAVARTCDYVRQAAQGLQHAHECGMVHRDIKPANLLVTRQSEKHKASTALTRAATGDRWGTVKILDMGLARLTDPATGTEATHLTQIGTIMGTPDYIAPEQAANSRTCDIRADIYSLGCTFYYLLAGQPPFPTGTLIEKLLSHKQDTPTPVEEARRSRLSADSAEPAHVPQAVQAILNKMMAKKPQDRFQTPGEAAETLADVVRDLAEDATEVGVKAERTFLEADDLVPIDFDGVDTAAGDTNAAHAATAAAPLKSHRTRRFVTAAVVCGIVFVGALIAQKVTRERLRANAPVDTAAPTETAAPAETVASVTKSEPPEEAPWQKLVGRIAKTPSELDELRHDLLRYRTQFFNTARAGDAAALLARLPSPFDALERHKIDAKQVFDWQPKELVGVLGSWMMVNDPKKPDVKYQHALAVSPDGRYVISGGPRGLLRVWDIMNQLEHKTQSFHRQILQIAFAPDARTFATASLDDTTNVWDAKSREPIHALDKKDRQVPSGRSKVMTSVAYSPDGKFVATAGAEGFIRVWDANTGAAFKSLDGKLGKITSLTFTPDGKHLFWAGDNGQVRWTAADATTADAGHQWRARPGPIKTLSFSPDGQTLVLGDGKEGIRLCAWNGTAFKPMLIAPENLGYVHGVAFAPDGKTFVSGSDDKTVKIWDTKTGRVKQSWELRFPIYGVVFAPDGRHFLTANGNSTVYVFRLAAASTAVAGR